MKVIALRGTENTGKSKCIKQLIQMLKEEYAISFGLLEPKAKADKGKDISDSKYWVRNALSVDGDVYAIFEYNGLFLGITSQGDGKTYLKKAYTQICSELESKRNKKQPDIFICAIRRKGDTISYVEEICDEPPVVVYDKASVTTIEESDVFCAKSIENEVNHIQAKILARHLSRLCPGTLIEEIE